MCKHQLKKNSVHCGGCHRDFGGIEAFDRHQSWDPFSCMDPPYPRLTEDKNGVFRQTRPGVRS